MGSLDTLRDDAEALAAALRAAGTPHEHIVVEGMPHGFAQMEFLPPARESIDRMLKFLDVHLSLG